MDTNQSKIFFDYIVVGTGPAGAVLAKTLTDDKKTSVLVLEAGENNDRDRPIRDSSFAPELEEKFFPQYFWQGEGVAQEKLDDRTFEWTTGRLSGGGSSINGEQYVRPTPSVLKEWEGLLGPLWSPEQAILNFKQLENYHGKTNNPEIHGFDGRLNIRQTPTSPPSFTKKLVSAIEDATGFNKILDYNDPRTRLGPFNRWQLYQKRNGDRESSSTAFLSSDIMTPEGIGVYGRKLRVFYKSTALRILFEGKMAIGIEFLKEGQKVQAFARKKVIISYIAEKLSKIDPTYQLVNPTLETINDDGLLENYIKENFGHNHHQQSSLRMAPFNMGGVVDRFGRVHGVNHLIVADAQIIPFTVDGNTSAAAFLIGYTIAKQLLNGNLNN